MTRRSLFKRTLALLGVAVASKLPMPEPPPAPLRPYKAEGWTLGNSTARNIYYDAGTGTLHSTEHGGVWMRPLEGGTP